MNFHKILKYTLLVVSCGFYCLDVADGHECPGHPKTPEEIIRESRERDPSNRLKRKQLDEIQPEKKPHSQEDADKFISK